VQKTSLNNNYIRDAGAKTSAKLLQDTDVYMVYLSSNEIGAETEQLLKGQYPHIKCIF
jgi:hypothetical protein